MWENIIFPVYYNYDYYRITNQKIKSTFNYRRLYFYYCHEYLNHLKVKLSLSLSLSLSYINSIGSNRFICEVLKYLWSSCNLILKLRNFKLDAVDQFDFWVDHLLVIYSHHKYHTYFVTLLINSAS